MSPATEIATRKPPQRTPSAGSDHSVLDSVAGREHLMLATYATHSEDTAGRDYPEPPHTYRGPFQRDRDRILHCSAFRRLSGKMQVFTGDMGEYHRTRLTHTFEVASIARTITRVLRLNEDLTEALALMHDIGHPPFGHCGEDVLNECLQAVGGFSHNAFALTIAQQLEQRYTGYPGLNLSAEVLEGQAERADKQHGAVGPTARLEVQVVDIADSLAYDAHDIDDALQMGLLTIDELSQLRLVRRALEQTELKYGTLSAVKLRPALVHELIDLQVSDFLEQAVERLRRWNGCRSEELSEAGVRLSHSIPLCDEQGELEAYLFEHVYRHPQLMTVRRRAADRLHQLFDALTQQPDRLPLRFRQRTEQVGAIRAVGEYLAGMTDRFCDMQYAFLQQGSGPLADW
ncbi:dGTP triphosphohydrolase [Roseimaritima ulvae]